MQSFLKNTALYLFPFLVFSTSSQAVDKVLLIGVSEYQSKKINNLPGISLDLNMMHKTVQRLGFDQQNIQSLEKKQATYANIKQKITGWLTRNVYANDRVLIYFSGHGSRIPDINGDEADKMDEVLVPYDARIKRVAGENYNTLERVILDDDLSQWLAKIPSKSVYVFVDACNSGTAYKGISNQSSVKYLNYPKGMHRLMLKSSNVDSNLVETNKADLSNVVFLSAAQDDEFALATSKGSVFTLGLEQTVREALINNKEQLTPIKLQKKITHFIKTKISNGEIKGTLHHPQLMASSRLKARSLFPISKPNSNSNSNQNSNQNQNPLDRLYVKGKTLKITALNLPIKIGDAMVIEFEIKESNWYLNIVSIGSDGEKSVLFPNAFDKNNQIPRGRFRLPTPKMNFELRATEPKGNSYIYAFLTRKKLNFYQQFINDSSANGQMEADFASLSARSTRNIVAVAKKSIYYAGKLTINIQ